MVVLTLIEKKKKQHFFQEINMYGMGRINFNWSAYALALLPKKAGYREVSPIQHKTRGKALICTDLFHQKTHHFPTEGTCSVGGKHSPNTQVSKLEGLWSGRFGCVFNQRCSRQN